MFNGVDVAGIESNWTRLSHEKDFCPYELNPFNFPPIILAPQPEQLIIRHVYPFLLNLKKTQLKTIKFNNSQGQKKYQFVQEKLVLFFSFSNICCFVVNAYLQFFTQQNIGQDAA